MTNTTFSPNLIIHEVKVRYKYFTRWLFVQVFRWHTIQVFVVVYVLNNLYSFFFHWMVSLVRTAVTWHDTFVCRIVLSNFDSAQPMRLRHIWHLKHQCCWSHSALLFEIFTNIDSFKFSYEIVFLFVIQCWNYKNVKKSIKLWFINEMDSK